MQILEIKDEFKSEIKLNEELVHTSSPTEIQVEQKLLNKHTGNNLYVRVKLPPRLVDSTKQASDQSVDLPPELLECLLLGIAVKASSIKALSNDPRTGTSYVQNPYMERYELAIKKARDNGYTPQTSMKTLGVFDKGFV